MSLNYISAEKSFREPVYVFAQDLMSPFPWKQTNLYFSTDRSCINRVTDITHVSKPHISKRVSGFVKLARRLEKLAERGHEIRYVLHPMFEHERASRESQGDYKYDLRELTLEEINLVRGAQGIPPLRFVA